MRWFKGRTVVGLEGCIICRWVKGRGNLRGAWARTFIRMLQQLRLVKPDESGATSSRVDFHRRSTGSIKNLGAFCGLRLLACGCYCCFPLRFMICIGGPNKTEGKSIHIRLPSCALSVVASFKLFLYSCWSCFSGWLLWGSLERSRQLRPWSCILELVSKRLMGILCYLISHWLDFRCLRVYPNWS